MPAKTRQNVRHLLRRTEFVDRPARVDAFMAGAFADISAVVDEILDAPANPASVAFTQTENWQQGVELTHFWLDRMAHDSSHPLQEKMAFFWHGHFCSELGKVGSGVKMREQIDLFRTDGLGNLRSLARDMSTQVAMLRYLDNNQNRASSPNQNFARELMELFLLGVGNYTEADVEAGTAAWTGHTDNWETDEYIWRAEWHDSSSKNFLGVSINNGADQTLHGIETIETMLGSAARVPNGASSAANRGRPTREVAAEFVSRKLWAEFADTAPSGAVINAMRDTAIANDFAIKPWLKTMFMRDEFYTTQARQGLVRSPVEFIVSILVATGLRSADATPMWVMEGMGQRPLYPPNVSGWKTNGYWVNASAMERRAVAASHMNNRASRDYWDDGIALVRLAGGNISRDEIRNTLDATQVVDRILELMRLEVSANSRNALIEFSSAANWWDRHRLVYLILLTPDMHVA